METKNMPYTIGISGTLEKKAINFYREQIIDYNENGILMDDAFLNKYGTLFLKNKKLYTQLLDRKEQYFNKSINTILNFANYKFKDPKIKAIIKDMTFFIKQIKSNSNYALLETFYQIIKKATNESIKGDLLFFEELLTYFNSEAKINLINLNLILASYKENPHHILKYLLYELKNTKLKTFKVDEDELFDTNREILFLGEFIAPERVSLVARSLYEVTDLTYFTLPIYFLIKNNQTANNFLKNCAHLTNSEEITKMARKYTNENIINLVRSKYDLPY